jgi:Putative Ig domain
MIQVRRKFSLMLVSILALSGCQIDGLFTDALNSAKNAPPQISGSAISAVKSGQLYQFVPTANDPDGQLVTFTITNKPLWASFSTGSGELSGTPSSTAVGTYADIVITATDGEASTSMRPFAITVLPSDSSVATTPSPPAASSPINPTSPAPATPTSPTTGPPSTTAALSWTVPTENADGTPLTNLAGYRVYHGTSAAALSDVRHISRPDLTQYLFESLTSGTHYFAITALNASGVESALSGIGSKIIP